MRIVRRRSKQAISAFLARWGPTFIDYIIADKTVAPFEHQPFYMEKIAHLPDCYQVNDTKRKIGERTPTRQEAGLPEKGFVFCCFNNNWKITPDVFGVWMRLLHIVEDSVLWLLGDNESAERNLRKEAQTLGIDPARLVFASRLPFDKHLARHRLADLFLDTLPCNAHTTASDALWVGLPVLTCKGTAFAGRVGASLLYAVGLPELVTHSMEDYEALALRLAEDPSLLQGYRNRLATNRLTHPLFDTERFRRHIEAAYLQMWEIWQRGEQPRSFAVEAEGRTSIAAFGLASAFSQAVALHQAGRLVEAEKNYLQILKVQPNHFDSLHLLGVIYHQRGNLAEAVRQIDVALRIDPKAASAHNNRGNALRELKRLDEALASYDRALALKPDYAEAFNNRGNALKELKRLDEALASYDKALALKPDYAEALNNRGVALGELKRPDDALASYDKAMALKPDYAEAFNNRGNALEEAEASSTRRWRATTRRWRSSPTMREAFNNRGNALQELKRLDEALASYDRALALKPDYAEAFNNRGNVLQELKRLDEALASYDKALALKPDYAEAFNNRGNALQGAAATRRGAGELRQGDRVQARLCGGLLQPRQCAAGAEAARRGAGELRQGDSAQARPMRRPLLTAAMRFRS